MRPTQLLILLLLIGVTACELNEDDGDVTPTTEALQIPTVESTPATQTTPVAQSPGTPPVSRAITLTVWTSPELAPDSELPGAAVLAEQLEAFDSDHSELELLVESKTVSDQGGILSYLRTGRSVAPTILPDIVMLPSSQLMGAAQQGLIYPIDNYFDEEALTDLFPAARSLSLVDERVYAYPFATTNLQHLVYNSRLITDTVSTDWSELIESETARLIFPAAAPPGAELTVQFYLENGGTFLNDVEQSSLQLEPLTAALEEILNGANGNLIVMESGTASSVEQAWQVFQNNPQFIVQTSATYFLQQRAATESVNYTVLPLPTLDGATTPRVSTWNWAISTPDPARQAMAAELIRFLVSPPNSGAWTQAGAILPAGGDSLSEWPDEEYVAFLETQLRAAEPLPPGLNTTILQSLSQATSAVLLGLSSPTEAATQAVESLEQ